MQQQHVANVSKSAVFVNFHQYGIPGITTPNQRNDRGFYHHQQQGRRQRQQQRSGLYGGNSTFQRTSPSAVDTGSSISETPGPTVIHHSSISFSGPPCCESYAARTFRRGIHRNGWGWYEMGCGTIARIDCPTPWWSVFTAVDTNAQIETPTPQTNERNVLLQNNNKDNNDNSSNSKTIMKHHLPSRICSWLV